MPPRSGAGLLKPWPSSGISALLLALTTCVTTRVAPQRIDFREPLVVEASRTHLDLAGKNDEELLAIGNAAQAAGDHARAAEAFSRIVDLFPGSRHRPVALLQAGFSYRSLAEWRLALERFRTLQEEYLSPDSDEAGLRVAECLYNLHQLADARTELSVLAERPGLEPALRIRALDQRGIIELEMSDLEASERSLEAALATWNEAQYRERLDERFAAEAQYYLGEVWRQRFLAVPLDPSTHDLEALATALEAKAQLLLTAQDQYLKAVGMRNPEAAVAAGYRIGGLYDELFAQMVQAPLPPNLDVAKQTAYRQELGERVRILIHKSIRNYEETLSVAQRAGVSGALVEATHASLERMKGALREIDAQSIDGTGARGP